MINVASLKEAFTRLPPGAREAEASVESHELSLVEAHSGEVSGASQSSQTAFYVRVSGERTGYAYTQDLDGDPDELLGEAYANSLNSERPAPDEIRRGAAAIAADYGSLKAESGIAALGRFAVDFGEGVSSSAPMLDEVFVDLRSETTGLYTINSHGLDTGFTRPLYILSAVMNASRGGRSFTTNYNRVASSLAAFSLEEFAARGREMLECQFDPSPFASGRHRAVLHRNVVYNILSTAWQLFSGHRYLEGSSLFSGKLGSMVASPSLSLKDYPAHAASGFDFPCDCEGTPGKALSLVDRGSLAGLMHNMATAAALKAEPTGNAGRRPLLYGNIATDILVTPRNVCVEPGEASLEDLLRHMGDGLLVTTSFDVFHSINIASGAFSIPCKGVIVRQGRREAATGPLVVTGKLGDLLWGIEEVANDLYIGTMLALDNYGIGACSLRVEGLDFSGQ